MYGSLTKQREALTGNRTMTPRSNGKWIFCGAERLLEDIKRINSSNCISNLQKEEKNMAEFQTPVCDNNHDLIEMRRVWSDGHGNAVYQCPNCGRKMQGRDSISRR